MLQRWSTAILKHFPTKFPTDIWSEKGVIHHPVYCYIMTSSLFRNIYNYLLLSPTMEDDCYNFMEDIKEVSKDNLNEYEDCAGDNLKYVFYGDMSFFY